MNEVDKKVLYKFVELHRVHPDGDVLFLWVQAGGKVASQQPRAVDGAKSPACKCNAYQLENFGCKCGAA